MWGSDTLATEVSSTSMNVASMTEAAISQGLADGRQADVAATAWAGTLTSGSSSVPSRADRSGEQLAPRRHAAALPRGSLAHEGPFGVAGHVTERRAHAVEGRHVGVRALEVRDEVVRAGRR